MALDGTVELLVSGAVLAEVADVLSRPSLRRKYPALTSTAVRDYIELIASRATFVQTVPEVVKFSRDEDDEPYLNLAIAGQAAYIVSRDNDLLALSDSADETAGLLRTLAPHLKVMNPPAFLHQLLSSQLPSDT